MKKRILSVLLCTALTAGMLAGCGAKKEETPEPEVQEEETKEAEEETTAEETGKTADPNKTDIKLGITASFEHFTSYIPEMMAEWGYNVELVMMDDPVVANTALVEGSLDASYHQHLPYLQAYVASSGEDLVAAEPYIMSSMDAIVSIKYENIDEIPDGATIAVANDDSNLSVNLEDLASIGWIKLKEIPEGSFYTLFDIEENVKNLNFLEVDMFSRAASLQDEADLAMIFYTNSGAAKYGYNLIKMFDENIAYPQVVAIRGEDAGAQWVADLMEAFTSDAQKEKIAEKNDPVEVWKILF